MNNSKAYPISNLKEVGYLLYKGNKIVGINFNHPKGLIFLFDLTPQLLNGLKELDELKE